MKNDLATLESKQLRMYLFLQTVYIISVVADKRACTHIYTNTHAENQSALGLLSTLGKQVLSLRRIRHLLLSGAAHIHSPKTILDNHKQERLTQKHPRHNRACCNKRGTGAGNLPSAPIKHTAKHLRQN